MWRMMADGSKEGERGPGGLAEEQGWVEAVRPLAMEGSMWMSKDKMFCIICAKILPITLS